MVIAVSSPFTFIFTNTKHTHTYWQPSAQLFLAMLSHLEIHVLAVEGGVLGERSIPLAIATLNGMLVRPAGVEPYRI